MSGLVSLLLIVVLMSLSIAAEAQEVCEAVEGEFLLEVAIDETWSQEDRERRVKELFTAIGVEEIARFVPLLPNVYHVRSTHSSGELNQAQIDYYLSLGELKTIRPNCKLEPIIPPERNESPLPLDLSP